VTGENKAICLNRRWTHRQDACATQNADRWLFGVYDSSILADGGAKIDKQTDR